MQLFHLVLAHQHAGVELAAAGETHPVAADHNTVAGDHAFAAAERFPQRQRRAQVLRDIHAAEKAG